jgi:hypothetical protein
MLELDRLLCLQQPLFGIQPFPRRHGHNGFSRLNGAWGRLALVRDIRCVN